MAIEIVHHGPLVVNTGMERIISRTTELYQKAKHIAIVQFQGPSEKSLHFKVFTNLQKRDRMNTEPVQEETA